MKHLFLFRIDKMVIKWLTIHLYSWSAPTGLTVFVWVNWPNFLFFLLYFMLFWNPIKEQRSFLIHFNLFGHLKAIMNELFKCLCVCVCSPRLWSHCRQKPTLKPNRRFWPTTCFLSNRGTMRVRIVCLSVCLSVWVSQRGRCAKCPEWTERVF